MPLFSRSVFRLAAERASYRSYVGAPDDALAALEKSLATLPPSPFGTPVRVVLIRNFDPASHGVTKLGTYGVIQGATHFLVGVMPARDPGYEDMGYVFEVAILAATDAHLQTCWVGGTLRRDAFARAAGASPEEVVPVVTPVGRARERRSLVDLAFRFVAGSKDRKPWGELFFVRNFDTPMVPPQARDQEILMPGAFLESGLSRDACVARALSLVRRAPSASNRQPWRVVYDPDQGAAHFYLSRTPGYRTLTDVDLQRIDMGIAMCHFELGCAELGLPGTWTRERFLRSGVPAGLEPVATFQMQG